MIGPPEVPAGFWTTDQIRDALEGWHMGKVIAAYRMHPHHTRPISQEIVGGWVGITQAQLSRIENGPPIKDLDRLVQWATLLGIPAHLLWFKLPHTAPRPDEAFAESGFDSMPPETLLALEPFWPPSAINGTWRRTNDDASVMHALRAADRRVGGSHLYSTVVTYLYREVGPRLFGGCDSTASNSLYAGAATLTEMAGWMAHDAGRDAAAGQHFDRAFALASLSSDAQLGAHILASMSHLAHHRNQPETAITLAQQGCEALAGKAPHPELQAQLFAMQARGRAATMDPGECTRLLVAAEKALKGSHAEPPSEWVSPFDEGSLACEAARCMEQLGDFGEARRQAERAVALRPGDRTRSRAFGQLILARVLIAQGKLDEACALAQGVLDATQALGSFLVLQQLLDLKHVVERKGANRLAVDFLPRLDEGLTERMWLGRWINTKGYAGWTEAREGA